MPPTWKCLPVAVRTQTGNNGVRAMIMHSRFSLTQAGKTVFFAAGVNWWFGIKSFLRHRSLPQKR